MNIDNKDIKDVAVYIGLSCLSKGISISPLKLQKILYYFQSWFMVFYGRQNTLFQDIPQAWVNGPVYPVIYYQYKDKCANMCDHLGLESFGANDIMCDFRDISLKLSLDDDKMELLESVLLLYGRQTQNQLIWLTHSEVPWAEARRGLAPWEKSEKELSLDLMYEYYLNRRNRNKRIHEA